MSTKEDKEQNRKIPEKTVQKNVRTKKCSYKKMFVQNINKS